MKPAQKLRTANDLEMDLEALFNTKPSWNRDDFARGCKAWPIPNFSKKDAHDWLRAHKLKVKALKAEQRGGKTLS